MAIYDKNKNLIAGGTLYADAPVGSILAFGGEAAPSGWLLCQGQAISRTTYKELFAAIGTSFGAGDGSTTFNIPDLREATTKGIGLSGKTSNHYDSDGVALGEFVEDRIQLHTHSGYNHNESSGSQTGVFTVNSGDRGFTGNWKTTTQVTGRSGNTTEVKAVGVNYIIKAKQVALPADLVAGVKEVVSEGEQYSTTEVKTNKTWIDGKPIYRKVLPFTNGVISSNVTPNVAQIIELYGIGLDNDNFFRFPYNNGSVIVTCFFRRNTGVVELDGISSTTSRAGIIIAEYTKTTD